ncbi:hypothetical protein [Paracoccus mutanolyticus]|uniref:hypothetical protein n=1 Tax=Paracoccus mutanolyticus TaxID=1499308 RepID=UPI00167A6EBF|nr:hypothetical protein [Paracoccus mutanolyticus]
MIPDIVADLHPPRLPAPFTAPGWDDFLAAAGLGLMLAALLVAIAMPALRRRARPPRLSHRLALAAGLPPADRLLALARILAEQGRALPPDQRRALYRGEPGDPDAVEALIRSGTRERLRRRAAR